MNKIMLSQNKVLNSIHVRLTDKTLELFRPEEKEPFCSINLKSQSVFFIEPQLSHPNFEIQAISEILGNFKAIIYFLKEDN